MSEESMQAGGTGGSTRVVRPPSREVLSAAQAIDDAIGMFLTAVGKATAIGKYESDVEARLLYALVVRGTEGAIELARKDLVLLPAAMSVARATFETAIRTLWMLDPDDPYEREVRWLAHLRADEVHFTKVAAELQMLGLDSGSLLEAAKRYAEFGTAVAAKLPAGKIPLTRTPKLPGMLKSLKSESQYVLYRHLSQYVHGTHLACSIYRHNLGTAKQLGEFVTAADWWDPLWVCGSAVINVGLKLAERQPVTFDETSLRTTIERVRTAVAALKEKPHATTPLGGK